MPPMTHASAESSIGGSRRVGLLARTDKPRAALDSLSLEIPSSRDDESLRHGIPLDRRINRHTILFASRVTFLSPPCRQPLTTPTPLQAT